MTEVVGDIAEDDVDTLTEEFFEGIREIIEEEGTQTALGIFLRLAANEAIDVVGLAVDEFAQDMNTQIACGTRQQHIAQRPSVARPELSKGVALQQVVDGGVVEKTHPSPPCEGGSLGVG